MKSSSKQASTEQTASALLAILVIVGLTAGAWYWMQQKNAKDESSQMQLARQEDPVMEPTPTPQPRAIPHGKVGFSISTSQDGPQMSTGFLDPYDPAMGAKQTISLTLTDTVPIGRVTAVIQTDNKKSEQIVFNRVSGSDISGEWQGTWTVNDTYNYMYIYDFEAQSSNGVTKVQSTFR